METGHQDYRDLYGDWVPHLLIYYTATGYSSSGYNRDAAGWIQYSSSIYPSALQPVQQLQRNSVPDVDQVPVLAR